ncbi:MAG: hypothetical protein ACKVHP_16465, partial [Verrucomicrobiales bacterium]
MDLAETLPATCNECVGATVPIPTLPLSKAVKAVTLFVPSCSAYLERKAKAELTICWRGEISLSR